MDASEYDYASPADQTEGPPTSIPRVIGIMNIIFAGLLLLCGLWQIVNVALQSTMAPMMAGQQAQAQKAMEQQRQAELRDLQQREKASKDPQEKAALQAQEKALQAQPVPNLPDMTQFMNNPRTKTFTLADAATGMLLNILLLVSGIGLLKYREWGRVTALWVAALKIVRLIALYSFFIVAIVPDAVQQFRRIFEEMAKAGPPGQKGPGPEQFATFATAMGIAMTVYGILMILIGSIYPLVVLILLTRPRVKAACAAPQLHTDV
jgi:hypothetical protein